MTDHPQRKDRVDVWLDFFDKYKEQQGQAPHTPPSEPAPDNIWKASPLKGCEPCKHSSCEYCDFRGENAQQYSQRIRTEERERVLDNLKERFTYRQHEWKRMGEKARFSEYDYVLGVVESLRRKEESKK